MIKRLSIKITDLFVNRGIINNDEYEIYVYGFDITLYTIISTSALLFIGLIFHKLIDTIITISIFYICQSSGGGYHASTHGKCFAIMCIGLIFALLFEALILSTRIYVVISILSLILLFSRPLVLHKNKSFLQDKKKQLIRKSIFSLLICVVSSCILITFFNIPISTIATAFMLATASRYYAIIDNKYHIISKQ